MFCYCQIIQLHLPLALCVQYCYVLLLLDHPASSPSRKSLCSILLCSTTVRSSSFICLQEVFVFNIAMFYYFQIIQLHLPLGSLCVQYCYVLLLLDHPASSHSGKSLCSILLCSATVRSSSFISLQEVFVFNIAMFYYCQIIQLHLPLGSLCVQYCYVLLLLDHPASSPSGKSLCLILLCSTTVRSSSFISLWEVFVLNIAMFCYCQIIKLHLPLGSLCAQYCYVLLLLDHPASSPSGKSLCSILLCSATVRSSSFISLWEVFVLNIAMFCYCQIIQLHLPLGSLCVQYCYVLLLLDHPASSPSGKSLCSILLCSTTVRSSSFISLWEVFVFNIAMFYYCQIIQLHLPLGSLCVQYCYVLLLLDHPASSPSGKSLCSILLCSATVRSSSFISLWEVFVFNIAMFCYCQIIQLHLPLGSLCVQYCYVLLLLDHPASSPSGKSLCSILLCSATVRSSSFISLWEVFVFNIAMFYYCQIIQLHLPLGSLCVQYCYVLLLLDHPASSPSGKSLCSILLCSTTVRSSSFISLWEVFVFNIAMFCYCQIIQLHLPLGSLCVQYCYVLLLLDHPASSPSGKSLCSILLCSATVRSSSFISLWEVFVFNIAMFCYCQIIQLHLPLGSLCVQYCYVLLLLDHSASSPSGKSLCSILLCSTTVRSSSFISLWEVFVFNIAMFCYCQIIQLQVPLGSLCAQYCYVLLLLDHPASSPSRKYLCSILLCSATVRSSSFISLWEVSVFNIAMFYYCQIIQLHLPLGSLCVQYCYVLLLLDHPASSPSRKSLCSILLCSTTVRSSSFISLWEVSVFNSAMFYYCQTMQLHLPLGSLCVQYCYVLLLLDHPASSPSGKSLCSILLCSTTVRSPIFISLWEVSVFNIAMFYYCQITQLHLPLGSLCVQYCYVLLLLDHPASSPSGKSLCSILLCSTTFRSSSFISLWEVFVFNIAMFYYCQIIQLHLPLGSLCVQYCYVLLLLDHPASSPSGKSLCSILLCSATVRSSSFKSLQEVFVFNIAMFYYCQIIQLHLPLGSLCVQYCYVLLLLDHPASSPSGKSLCSILLCSTTVRSSSFKSLQEVFVLNIAMFYYCQIIQLHLPLGSLCVQYCYVLLLLDHPASSPSRKSLCSILLCSATVRSSSFISLWEVYISIGPCFFLFHL